MSLDRKPTEKVFVGRSHEQKQFRQMLEDSSSNWLMSITGAGGDGKTRLLERLKFICQEFETSVICVEKIIDFYDSKNQSKLGILSTIRDVTRDVTGRRAFQGFTGSLTRYDHNTPDSWRERIEAEERVIAAFVKAFQKLAEKQKIVLLFDTFEVVAGSEFGLWFLNDFLPQIHSFSIVVIGGRPEPAWQDSLKTREGVLTVQLPFFTPEEVSDYFKEAGESVDKDFTRQVTELSEGRPLFVALMVDWLREASLQERIDEVLSGRKEDFEATLVEGINNLAGAETSVLWIMAHVYHRFDAELLSYLDAANLLDGQSPHEIIQRLLRFSFIKQRENGCVLHDEMRDLITKYILNHQDKDQRFRRDISQQVLNYYSDKLTEEKTRPVQEQDQRKIDALVREHLYHKLYGDLENSYGYFWQLNDEGWHRYHYDHMGKLLETAEEVNRKRLHPDKVLDRQIKTIRAWILEETWQQSDNAITLTTEVISDPAGVKRLQATAYAARGLLIVRQGRHDEAVSDLGQAFKLYTELHDAFEAGESLSEERGIPTPENIKPERHLVLNSLGYVYSDLGRFPEAQKYYMDALKLSQSEKDTDWEASALVNLAHINRWLGNLQEALNLGYMSLDLRKRLNRPVLVAISYNALGMIYRDDGEYLKAQNYFEQARQIFKEFHIEWRESRVLRNLGWVSYLKHDYEVALKYMKDAHTIVNRLDARRELPDILHKEGRVYVGLGKFDEAKTRLVESAKLAQEFSDAYFTVNSFVDLGQVAYTTKQYEDVPEYCYKALGFKEKGYLLFPVYGKAELLLGDLAYEQGDLDKAFDHYGQAYSYWARHNEWRLKRRLDHLREKLLELTPAQRQRQTARLTEFWTKDETNILHRYPYLLSLLQQFSRDG